MKRYLFSTAHALAYIFCILGTLYLSVNPSPVFAECQFPISYSIGTVDPRFGVHFNDFRSSISKAERMWEYAAGKDLFVEKENGDITINMVYTSRQMRRQIVLKRNTQVHYLNDKIEVFNKRARDLEKDVGDYNQRLKQYNERLANFNQSAAEWNKEKSTNRQLFARLQSEKKYVDRWKRSLEKEALSLTSRQETLLVEQERFEASQKAIKREEQKLARLGAYDFQFEKAGEYVQQGNSKSINLYIYVDPQQMLNVLAHEFGHALGIKHTSQEGSIMHSYQTDKNFHLDHVTHADVAALRKICN